MMTVPKIPLNGRSLALSQRHSPTEGMYRDGPWFLPVSGGWLSADVGRYWNWWQMGFDVQPAGTSPMVEACVNAYARTVAMCPGDHWEATNNGGRRRVANSALSRLLKSGEHGPNDYESISDFLLAAVRFLVIQGNAYALAERNDRSEVNRLHLFKPQSSGVLVSPTSGDIFYHLNGNEVAEARFDPGYLARVPMRDVLHIRLNTDRKRLVGESPLLAAMPDIIAAGAMTAQQIAFYLNQARPSFVLSTDQILTIEQITQARDAVREQTKGENAGGTLIFHAGLKPHPVGATAEASQFNETRKGSDEHIALALGVPLQVLGMGGTTTPTDAIMRAWLAGGLGFVLNHVELGFDRLYRLRGVPDEYTQFDTEALMRSAFKERMEAYQIGKRAGVLSTNDARRKEELGDVEFGDTILAQQQDVPLGWWEKQPPAPIAAEPEPQVDPDDDAEDEEGDEDAERSAPDYTRSLLDAADEYDRRAA